MAENNNRSEQWWRVAYGLVRLRKGLDHFVDRKSRTLYNDVYISGLTSSVCNTCQINKHCHSGANIIPKCYNNTFCKNKFCDSICDRILSTYYPYQKTPIWANTDSTKWSDQNIGYWEIAKCFFNTPGYLDKEGPNTTDGSGLISICLNNKGIRSSISNVLVFEEVRDIRNKISHTADYKLDKQTADEYLEKMIELLNDARELRNDPFAIVNRRHLQDIKDGKSQCSRKTSTRMELEVCTHNLNNLEEDENYNMFDLNQMSDERIQFTAILVNMFSCLKEEMEKRTALRLMKHILPSAFSYDMDEAQLMCRRRVVDDLLKRIIFSSCETVKERFRQQLAKDKAGSKLATKLEKCRLSNEKIAEFRNLQKRRTQQNFEYSQCVRYIALINPLTDVDMIADKLLSAYIINLEEHSNIVHAQAKELKLYMFKTAISRCDKCVLPSLKDICRQLEIRCILCEDEERSERGDEEKSTVEAVLPSPNVNWFSNLGMCIKSAAEGSIVLTFDYTDPFALDKCLQECKNGSIVNFVKDIFTDEPVLKTIPEGEHNVHVEIKSTGANDITVILSASFLDRKNMCRQHDEKVPEHDVYICEELEVTRDLISQLQAENVLPENISFELFENIEGRRNTIHDLLCRCHRSFDHRQFYEIISKQNTHDKKNNNQHTLFTSICKIIKRGDSLAVEQTLVRRLATKDEIQQTGQFLEPKANTRHMKSQIHTDTNKVEMADSGARPKENIGEKTSSLQFDLGMKEDRPQSDLDHLTPKNIDEKMYEQLRHEHLARESRQLAELRRMQIGKEELHRQLDGVDLTDIGPRSSDNIQDLPASDPLIRKVDVIKSNEMTDFPAASVKYSEINIERKECNQKITPYMELLKEKGSDAVQQKLQKDLNAWKNWILNIGVVGESGSGKSALINAVLNLTADDEYSAPVGITEKKGTINSYINPKHPNIAFWDFSGVETFAYKKEHYLDQLEIMSGMNLSDFDIFLMTSCGRVRTNDFWFAKRIQKLNKKFIFCRTHTDIDVSSDKRAHPKSHNKEKLLNNIKDDILANLYQTRIEIKEEYIFLVDCFDKNSFDFKDLMHSLITNANTIKRDTMILSLSCDSNTVIEGKVKVLKKRIYKAAMLASLGNLVPVEGTGLLINAACLLSEAIFYCEQLGIDDKSITEICSNLNIEKSVFQTKFDLKTPMILSSTEGVIGFLSLLSNTNCCTDEKYEYSFTESLITGAVSYPLIVYCLNEILKVCESDVRKTHAVFVDWLKRKAEQD